MNTFRTNELLNELRSITASNQEVISTCVLSLNRPQLHWRKDQNTWSIMDILAHLNEYAAYYHEMISQKIEKTRFTEPRETFTSSPLGRSAWSSMKLGNAKNVKRKLRSPRLYNPIQNTEINTNDALDLFMTHQNNLLEILKAVAQVNLRKVRIPMSISKLIRLRLGDALMFIVYHNERHIQQILRLIENKDFPKNMHSK